MRVQCLICQCLRSFYSNFSIMIISIHEFSLLAKLSPWAIPTKILAQFSINNKYIFAFLGLFHVSDKILISFDILLEWRELFRRGCPVLNFIEAKTDLLVMKLNKVDVINYCGIWNDIILESNLSLSNFE